MCFDGRFGKPEPTPENEKKCLGSTDHLSCRFLSSTLDDVDATWPRRWPERPRSRRLRRGEGQRSDQRLFATGANEDIQVFVDAVGGNRRVDL